MHLEACADCDPGSTISRSSTSRRRFPSIKGFQVLSSLAGAAWASFTSPSRPAASPVALKLMRPSYTAMLEVVSVSLRNRRTHAVRSSRHRSHPSSGEHENAPLLHNGAHLGRQPGHFLQWPAATVPLVLQIMLDLARTLVCIHEQGIVHRDLKPGNILWKRVRGEEG